MPLKDSSLSPCDRLLARRKSIFIRDWILVLIALGLLLAAGAFHRDQDSDRNGPDPASASTVR